MDRLVNEQKKGNISRRIVDVKGIVQGVGFRPFIFQIARRYGLYGWVFNSSAGVQMEVEGEADALAAFFEDLRMQLPPLAQIDAISVREAAPAGYQRFEIRQSQAMPGEYVPIAPDVCTCADCLRELTTVGDRRYRYPFINCTNCGPRFSIVADIPYDRPNTSMRHFPLCEDCRREYQDPLDRRFHAQPNACPECGPQLSFLGGEPLQSIAGDPIELAAGALKEGKILAIKGLGGFHLACDATNEAAVARLRSRKHRYGKPLAVMMADMDQVRRFCELSGAEQNLLLSPRRPIVLLKQCIGTTIAPSVAQGLPTLGVLLPYTPVHYLLLAACRHPLVMTSGNISEEPLVSGNDEAVAKLSHIADCFLLHDREIVNKIDDSVTRWLAGREAVIRRARGYAPEPLLLPEELPEILACGPEQKNTFCLTRGRQAFVSQHIGDLENLSTFQYYERMIDFYKYIFRSTPGIVAHDLHPGYLSTQYARSLTNVQLVGVQHHHAHIAACMLENGLGNEQVIGISCDGTGYGTDGNLWGGEFFLVNYQAFTRLGHIKYVSMPGGAKAIKEPYRMAFGYLYSLFGREIDQFDKFIGKIPREEQMLMQQQIDKRLNAPLTSSCGRLFDAVAAMLDIGRSVRYEGEAAVRLESLIDEQVTASYNFAIEDNMLDPAPLLKDVYYDAAKGVPVSVIAAKFHNAVINGLAAVCCNIAALSGIKKVCLSGGVFQNAYLLEGLLIKLARNGLHAYWPQKLPANDGGISLGQAMVAHYHYQV